MGYGSPATNLFTELKALQPCQTQRVAESTGEASAQGTLTPCLVQQSGLSFTQEKHQASLSQWRSSGDLSLAAMALEFHIRVWSPRLSRGWLLCDLGQVTSSTQPQSPLLSNGNLRQTNGIVALDKVCQPLAHRAIQ